MTVIHIIGVECFALGILIFITTARILRYIKPEEGPSQIARVQPSKKLPVSPAKVFHSTHGKIKQAPNLGLALLIRHKIKMG